MHRDKRHLGKRSFPGRLTLEEWLAMPWRSRIQFDLARAGRSVGLVPLLRRQALPPPPPMRQRRSGGVLEKDSAPSEGVRAPGMVMPKTMHREWDRLNRLNHL